MTTTVQTIIDGPRNVIIKYEGVVTTNFSKETVVNPALLSDMDINGVKASKLRINKIVYDVEDLLVVNLYWKGAASDTTIWNLAGRGKIDAHRFGGLQNNATNPTGIIAADSDYQGALSTPLSFTIILELVKQ